jgi:hypothetical protein
MQAITTGSEALNPTRKAQKLRRATIIMSVGKTAFSKGCGFS